MPPPGSGAPYPGASQTPAFTLATPKKTVIKIVNPNSMQEIKLPVKADAPKAESAATEAKTAAASTTTPASKSSESAASQPPATIPGMS